MQLSARTAFPDWPQYNARITEAVAGLTAEQLAVRASPDHGPIWALAAHLAGARLYWLCVVCGEPGLEGLDVLNPETGEGWEDDESHPRSGDELKTVLDASWAVIAACLDRWTPAMLVATVERPFRGSVQHHTRISILNRLFSHDAYHAGEIGQLLGTIGQAELDLWGRRPTA
ncbi:MAG: DinB family protein [Chloroflexota bacterium]